MKPPIVIQHGSVETNARYTVNTSEEGKAKVNRAVGGPVRRSKEENTSKLLHKLLGLACRLLVVTLGLGAALGIAAIFDINA